MEEKERYVIRYDLDYNRCLIDTEENQGVGDYIQIVKLLNQQSKRIKELEQENQQLKQQLAEKEQEIESLRENSLSKRIFKEKLIPSHCMEQYEKYEQQIYKLTKDKISFALEHLEKVKENIKKVPITDFDFSGNFEKMYKQDAIRQIDNQIEELKKEMKYDGLF